MEIMDFTYLSKMCEFLMKKLGTPKGKEPFAKDANKNNIMMWKMFMFLRMQQVHLGLDYDRNMEILKCSNFEDVGSLFTFTENIVNESFSEIMNVSNIDFRSSCWTKSTLAHEQVKKWYNAKVRVYSESEFCLGKMHYSEKEAVRNRWYVRWKKARRFVQRRVLWIRWRSN